MDSGQQAGAAMLVRGLDNKEIDNYFSGMMTEKEMRPYIEGARRQGYRQLYGCQQKARK
ncbi:MAG: hypothetical protein UIV44_03055 [Bacteroidales bacterium]|jgi:hypothetical protein|nr:hypothetical protein [Bacteroidales bacterium]MDY4726228.1 hypothetical protein [Candidatus Cryptobacteroides sp.]MDY5198485.1 hypothetical protein [Candidatus Cryptobacteroides sp.]